MEEPFFSEFFDSILPARYSQDIVGARLQRQVQMGFNVRVLAKSIEQVGQVIVLLIGPICLPDALTAVSPEKYSGYNDFPMSGFYNRLRLAENLLDRFTANKRPCFRYNTICAVSIASILNL
jgi:hypothetical protein